MNHFAWLWADHGHFYGPMSGWIPDLTMLSIVVGWWHKHNCHEDGCWRIGHRVTQENAGVHVRRCRRHHQERHRREGATL